MRLLFRINLLAPFLSALIVVNGFYISPSLSADDWPMFGRSPNRNAVSFEKNLPGWWQFETRDAGDQVTQAAKNIKWSAKLGKRSAGEVVVANGLVWVGTNNRQPRDPLLKQAAPVLMCFREKDGQFLYQYVTKIPGDDQFVAFKSTPHNSAPMSEGDRLWFTTVIGEVVCLDVGPLTRGQRMAREVWKLDMRKDLGVCPSSSFCSEISWPTCSISLPYKDFIYVQTGNGPEDWNQLITSPNAPSLICLDKRTGKVIWSDNSPGKQIMDGQFSSPLVFEIEGQSQVVVPMGDGWVRSFDGLTGKLLWQFDANPKDIPRDLKSGHWNNLIATPVLYNQRIYLATGKRTYYPFRTGPGWIYCLDPKKRGDISFETVGNDGRVQANPNSGMIWRFGGADAKKNHIFSGTVGNLAIHEGLLVAADENGYVDCIDASTGKLCWKHDVRMGIETTPLIVGGKVYVAAEATVYLFALSKEKKLLGVIETENLVHVSPIAANGSLFLATHDTLYSIAGTERKLGSAQD